MSIGVPNEPVGRNHCREVVRTKAAALGHSPLSIVLWAAAAALALTAIWLGFQNLTLRTENNNLNTERRLAEIAYRAVQNQFAERSLLAETMINSLGSELRRTGSLARLQACALVSQADTVKDVQAIAVWAPDQQTGLLMFDNLPIIDPQQDYQIWVVDPAYPNPVNSGVFHVATGGRAALAFQPDQPIKQAATFAISLEKKGGVRKPEGPILLSGKLD
jgi:hypothetical protein